MLVALLFLTPVLPCICKLGNVGVHVLPQVFTTAAADEHKNIVTLAFQTIEKIVRDYFSYITETETSTFTDCVNCLIAFTNSRFNKDVSLNAIAFLRFCALKLAEGELGQPVHQPVDGGAAAEHKADRPMAPFTDRDDHLYFWFPLLAGESGAAGRHSLQNSFRNVLKSALGNAVGAAAGSGRSFDVLITC